MTRPNRVSAYFDREEEIRFDYRAAEASTATSFAQKGATIARIAILLVVLGAALGLLALCQGCKGPDQAILAADAGFYDSLGQEYEANLDAGRIWPLEHSTAGGVTLSPEIMSEDKYVRRKRAMRAWRALVEEGRREDEDLGRAGPPR